MTAGTVIPGGERSSCGSNALHLPSSGPFLQLSHCFNPETARASVSGTRHAALK